MTFATADLYDEFEESLQIAKPMFKSFGGKGCFSGTISTVKCHEDNSLVRAVLESEGNGRVLVVDGGGSLRCALLGDMLAELGVKNNWSGVVVYGCIRDSKAIDNLNIGVKAIDTNPRKSVKKGVGEKEIAVNFAEVVFIPGEYLYADEDGIVLSEKKL